MPQSDNEPTPAPATPPAPIQSLTEDERRILRVLSVVCEPIGQSVLAKVLDTLGWTGQNGAPLSRTLSKALRDRLRAQGLIDERQQALFCQEAYAEALTRECVADGTFPAIAAAAERTVPTSPRDTWYASGDRWLRLLRLALYSGQEAKLLTMLGLDGKEAATRVPLEQVKALALVALSPPDPAWLATLSPRLQTLILVPVLRESTLSLDTEPDLLRLAEEILAPLAQSDPDAAFALAEQRLLRGRLAEVAPLLAGHGDPEALELHGSLAFLQGDYAGAIARFEAAHQLVRKLTRKRNVFSADLPGAFYLSALLRRGERADLESVRRQAGFGERSKTPDPLGAVHRLLGELADILGGLRRQDESPWLAQPLRGAFTTLFQGLALHWLGRSPSKAQTKELTTWTARAAESGIDWYAREAVALLRAFRYPGQLPDLGEAPAGWVPITGLLTARPAWEFALDALKGLAAQPGSPGESAPGLADKRMAWHLHLVESHACLEPREQARGKRGGWTQGRPVSLQKLAEDQASYPYLTPQDRAICACIRQEVETTWYGNDGRATYRLDQERALVAAVGHPLVVRPGAPDSPVDLVRTGPTLAVVRRRGDILVAMDPYPPQGRSVLPVEETPSRIRIVQFEPKHHEIARILGPNGLSVPADGERRLLEGLASVAPLVTVHSDIGGGDSSVETAIADRRPHFHLAPMDGGLSLELYVHPFGDRGGPQLRPGEGRAILLTELDGQAVRCTRDLKGELTAARRTLSQCPVLDGNEDWSWSLDDPELALTALEQLHALRDGVVLDWPQGKRIALTPEAQLARMQVGIGAQGDWLKVSGELRLDTGLVIAMDELLKLAAGSRGRFVRLAEDQYLVLSNALRKRLDSLQGLTEDGLFHPLAAPAVAEAVDGMAVAAGAAWSDLLDRLAAAQELEPEIPSTLQAELRGYQAEGYRWLARLAHWGAGACLADDMGLGKTVQALALILARAPGGPTLVLAPTSVRDNWMDEAERFAPTLNPKRFGSGDRTAMLKEAGPFDLIVCSYGLLQSEADRLAEVDWQTVVADEAQAFKNATTKRSQSVMRLKAGFKMIATGTPIENRLGELWNLFRFVNPGLLGSQESFNRRFAIPIELDKDPVARARLRQLLRPFILRRLKSEVLSELPPRTEITLNLELTDAETALYEAVRRQAIERLEQNAASDSGQQRMQLFAEIVRLRRACCHPKLALPESDLPSAKLEAFGEIVEELIDNRHKALVFSQFVDHLNLIREYLDDRRIRYQYLDGSTPEPKRRAAVSAFQAGEGDLFLISLRAGGAGLNLTAADYVIHMDPWWNPAVEDQASDRAHRIGQERPVTVYRLVAKGTIEERILKLHATKRDLADGLLADTGESARLSYADMLALVREVGAGD